MKHEKNISVTLETGLIMCLTQNTGGITNSCFEFKKSEHKY